MSFQAREKTLTSGCRTSSGPLPFLVLLTVSAVDGSGSTLHGHLVIRSKRDQIRPLEINANTAATAVCSI